MTTLATNLPLQDEARKQCCAEDALERSPTAGRPLTFQCPPKTENDDNLSSHPLTYNARRPLTIAAKVHLA